MEKVVISILTIVFIISISSFVSASVCPEGVFPCDEEPNFKNFVQEVLAFLDLDDTPSTYSGQGALCLAVNPGENGIIFQNCTNASSSLGDANYWRLDGTNAPPSANWDMGSFGLDNLGATNLTGTLDFNSQSATNLSDLSLTNDINLNAFNWLVPTPTLSNHTANKEYVDSATASTAFDFFFTNLSSDIAGHFNMTESDLDLPENDLDSASLGVGTFSIFNWTTQIGQPEFNELRQGIYDVHVHMSKSGPGTRAVTITPKLYNISNDGSTRNLLITFETSDALTITGTEYDLHGVLSDPIMIPDGDRLNLELEATVSGGGSDVVVTTVQEGTTDSHLSIQTSSNAFEKIFIRKDGTAPLTANWDAGAFNITAKLFKGLFDWVIKSDSTDYLAFNGSTLSLNETKLNNTFVPYQGATTDINLTIGGFNGVALYEDEKSSGHRFQLNLSGRTFLKTLDFEFLTSPSASTPGHFPALSTGCNFPPGCSSGYSFGPQGIVTTHNWTLGKPPGHTDEWRWAGAYINDELIVGDFKFNSTGIYQNGVPIAFWEQVNITSNLTVGGDTNMVGEVSVGNSLEVNGNLNVTGTTLHDGGNVTGNSSCVVISGPTSNFYVC